MSDREDVVIEEAARALRAPVPMDPALDERIMAAVHAEVGTSAIATDASSGARAAWRWLSRRRTVRISPLAGFALAAGFAALVVLADRGTGTGASSDDILTPAAASDALPVASPAGATPVQFVLVAPGAASVTLVGDFNGWDAAATPLRVVASGGVWTVEVRLPPGRHQYAFIVDGSRWMPDPAAPRAVADDFGTPSSVVTVGERSS